MSRSDRRSRGWDDTLVALQGIYGSLLYEAWLWRVGIGLVSSQVNTWTGAIRGTVLTAPGSTQRPAFAADGSNFHSISVPQFDGSNDSLQVVNGSVLWTLAQPTVCLVARFRSAIASQKAIMSAGDHPFANTAPYMYTDGSGHLNTECYPKGAALSTATLGTSVNFIEGIKRVSDNKQVTGINGVDLVGSAAGPVAISVKDLYFGNDRGGSFADISMPLIYVLSSEPSSAQRAAARAFCRGLFGF
jgi:hypothetical protein